MHRMAAYSRLLARPMLMVARSFCTSASKIGSGDGENIVDVVLFERLPVVVPKIDPVVYAFQEFSFQKFVKLRRWPSTPDQIVKTMEKMKADGVDVMTYSQYMRPSKRHMPVSQYITPEAFEKYRVLGMQMLLQIYLF